MAEFSEVIKQFKRLCKSVSPLKCSRGECPLGCENIGQCRKVAFERPEKFEEQVMSWAADHPEPVYPTWGEYLCNIGLIHDCGDAVELGRRLFHNSIPADIAQKLGIEPQENL